MQLDVDLEARQGARHFAVNRDDFHKLGPGPDAPCVGYGNWLLIWDFLTRPLCCVH